MNIFNSNSLRFVYSESIGQLLIQVPATNQTMDTIGYELALIRCDLTSDPRSTCNKTYAISEVYPNNPGAPG
jgi:hypothetical protein